MLYPNKIIQRFSLILAVILIFSFLVSCENEQVEIKQENKSFIDNRQGEAPQDGIYLAPVRIGIHWGYIDQNGEIVIEPKYLAANAFTSKLALVLSEEGYQFIDKNGSVAFELNLENAKPFSEGLAGVKSNGKWGYIDKQGNYVIEPQFSITGSFSEGFAVASLNGIKSGFIDKQGTFIIQPIYDMASPFSDGLAFVYPNFNVTDSKNKSAYIGYDGEIIFQPNLEVYNFDVYSEGRAIIYKRDSMLYGYMDKSGETIVEATFASALPFSEGLASIYKDYTCRYIDVDGNTVISDSAFSQAKSFYEGMAAVKVKDSWGFIDKQGKTIIDFELQAVGHFSKVD